ncbi:MAG: hypothetical protein KatS3mg132_930 [Limisphaera sp.]|nr:MAG: hypothetical protein KatS3mg132_930 [Limisphaera sp.]
MAVETFLRAGWVPGGQRDGFIGKQEKSRRGAQCVRGVGSAGGERRSAEAGAGGVHGRICGAGVRGPLQEGQWYTVRSLDRAGREAEDRKEACGGERAVPPGSVQRRVRRYS